MRKRYQMSIQDEYKCYDAWILNLTLDVYKRIQRKDMNAEKDGYKC